MYSLVFYIVYGERRVKNRHVIPQLIDSDYEHQRTIHKLHINASILRIRDRKGIKISVGR